MINEKDLFRLTLYGARYALPVTRAEHEGFENEQVEGALQEGDAIVGIVLGRHPTQACITLGRMSTGLGRLIAWNGVHVRFLELSENPILRGSD